MFENPSGNVKVVTWIALGLEALAIAIMLIAGVVNIVDGNVVGWTLVLTTIPVAISAWISASVLFTMTDTCDFAELAAGNTMQIKEMLKEMQENKNEA